MTKRSSNQNALARVHAVVDSLADGVCVTDFATMRVVDANLSLKRMFGHEADRMLGVPVHEFFTDKSEQEIRAEFEALRNAGGGPLLSPGLHTRNDGTVFPFEVSRRLMRIGGREYVIAVIRDISQRLLEQGRLLKNESLMRDISDALADVLWTIEYETGVLSYASAGFERLFSRDPLDLLWHEDAWLDAVHAEDRQRVKAALSDVQRAEWQEEYRVVKPSGETRWIRHRMYLVRGADKGIARTVNIASDITVLRESDELMMQLVQFDSLTGLLNRSQFVERLNLALDMARRNNSLLAVVSIDLDRFMGVNEMFGAAKGDLVLCEMSRRLQAAVRSADFLSRIGADSFAVALTHLATASDAGAVVRKLLDACAAPVTIDGQEITVTASAGIALFPADAQSGETLLGNAAFANSRASRTGCDHFEYYSAEMTEQSLVRLRMAGELRRAIASGQFLLHFQPKLSLREGRCCGYEALLRWKHPERGLIPPVDFIPVLEETGLIETVGAWVIEEAIRQIAEWKRNGHFVGPVAINLSVTQLRKPGLASHVAHLCSNAGVLPEEIEFEVTESMMMNSTHAAKETLAQLRQLGMRISIDDFGTGYSSLSYLKRLPVDTLKIDRSFVQDIESGNADESIVGAIVGLAHALSLNVVAEGVETPQQLDILQRLGCDSIQGYVYSKPIAAQECAMANLASLNHVFAKRAA
jgi:diguanylate cyclase (GGDEF)-like protein/PAS domain S-box-containing protein